MPRCGARCPITVNANEVIVATSEPFDISWVPEIEAFVKRPVRLQLGAPRGHHALHARVLFAGGVGALRQQDHQRVGGQQLRATGRAGQDQGPARCQRPGASCRSSTGCGSTRSSQRASDIHLEPRREMAAIRLRIDGVLHTAHQVPAAVMNAMTARIKLLGAHGRDRAPPPAGRPHQDPKRPEGAGGLPGAEVEMRLSTIPTAFGEKVVMRIFDPGTVDKPFDALAFSATEAERWQTLMGQ